jgi:hypothetical protein
MNTHTRSVIEKGLGGVRNIGALRPKGQYPLRSTVAALALLLCASCTVTTEKGNVAFGGKGAARGSGWAVAWDNEKSFSDGAIAGTAIAGLYYSAATAAAKEATSRTMSANATNQAINASNNATAVELGAQEAGVKTTEILAQPK